MLYNTNINFFTFILSTFLIFTIHTAVANSSTQAKQQPTIFAASISWDDEQAKEKLLNTAPEWDNALINSLFTAYLNPKKYGLPINANVWLHNIQFINAFWGPLRNPFNKYPRPAKVFIFLDPANPDTYYMLPLIKNSSDGNYYVFDKTQTQPILLIQWINNAKYIHKLQTSTRFNICNEYGNFPADSCKGKSYQAEAIDIQSAENSDDLSKNNLAQQPNIMSAHRGAHEDWEKIANSTEKFFKPTTLNTENSIQGSSIDWNKEEPRNKLLNTVAVWPNYKIIKENFEKIRNIRYFSDYDVANFSRRISWLYPDDGCWTRASAVIRDLFGPYNNFNNDLPRPSKVFAFGNLCANTTNSPEGNVTWWYHTAPIVRDAETNQTYVLDPSVNPSMPLTMEKWAETIASNSGACANLSNYLSKFNICNGYGTMPHLTCNNNYKEETRSMTMQSKYQTKERIRQTMLGRDANAVLGDLPPWEN